MAPRVDNQMLPNFFRQFIIISGGVVGGSDPPAYQRAEKERMEKAAREENEGGIGNLNHDEQVNVSKRAKQCSGEFTSCLITYQLKVFICYR